MLLVKRLSHTRKIISSCYFARLRKSSSGKGCSFTFCVTRMRTILDFADLSTIKIMIFEMMDGVYLLGNVFPIFWRRLWYRGRYIFFYNEFFPIFSRGENCDEILEILDVSQWRSGFEYLSTIKTVNDTGQRIFRILFHLANIAKLWFDIFRLSPLHKSGVLSLISRHYERYYGLCFEVWI